MLNKWLENDPKVTLVCAATSAVSLALSLTGALRAALPADIAWLAIVLCGTPILVGAFRGVVFEGDIKADLLVSLALIASAATGEYFAAGEVALIMQIGSLLEDYTSGKARESIEKLIRITPRMARVLRNGEETTVPAEEVVPGDALRVLAGETIPVDGVILTGETAVDQSVMTGESIPVEKKPGDGVFSGTVNQFGTFTMRSSAASEDSSLQRMIRLAREAEENKAPVVSAADRWATWLVLIALGCAAVTWIATGEFMRAVTLLVVFCPCAFILATPTAVLAGIGNAARYGIIIRSGDALERLAGIRRAAFDKTGTLTCGKPRVSRVVSFAEEYTEEDVLALAAAAEKRSEHPLGKAVVREWTERGGQAAEPFAFRVAAGRGVLAEVDGTSLAAGGEDLMREEGIDVSPAREALEKAWADGGTAILLSADGRLIGLLELRDTVRADARETVERLKSAGIVPVLLSGDNAGAVRSAAEAAGVDEAYSGLLPEQKMEKIRAWAGGDAPVCMIGDGVNDALALAAADAGIAMGGVGSDIAVESADAVLVSDELRRLPYLFRLTRKVMEKVKVNIIASLAINLTAIVLSALGILDPITGALWHNCGSVFVVVNAALLLREKDGEAAS